MREDKLSIQSMDFAIEIINLVKELKAKKESIISNQIDEATYKSLSSQCTSIRVMLISSINTAKQNTEKSK